jgi:hypothetical protein
VCSSDLLYDPAGFERGIDILRYRRYEPYLVQIHDRREAEPPLWGDVEIYDVETGRAKKVTVAERNLRQYREVFTGFLKKVESYCRRYGLGCTRTLTEVPFDELILRMMRAAGTLR